MLGQGTEEPACFMLSGADRAQLQEPWRGAGGKLLWKETERRGRGLELNPRERWDWLGVKVRETKGNLAIPDIGGTRASNDLTNRLTLRAERKRQEEKKLWIDKGELSKNKEDGVRGTRWALTLRTYVIKRSENTCDNKKR